MTDHNTAARQAWIQSGAPSKPEVPLCYRRRPDGSPAWRYVPVAEQGPDYLRERFRALGIGR
jgi:hypothetical protein